MSPTLLAPPTRHGLLPDARHLILPAGIVSSGWPAVEGTCAQVGIHFDDWQADLNRCILAKDSNGDYAADTVVMSIPRQAGKTFDIGGLVFADSIINPGTTTVWTAHRFKVARESFNELRAFAKRPEMVPHLDYDDITTAAGNECIPFRNGSRILFAARERGAIRGFTKVRRLVLDEAQILTEQALADMVPTMNQAVNPQAILMGTPPKPTDPSEVFTNLRSEALEGSADGVLYVEFAADKDADPDDRSQWPVANPSHPRRTSTKAILRMKKLLGDDDFRREGLGVWDSDAAHAALDLDRWDALADPDAREGARPSPVVFAVEVSPDRQWGMITLAGRRADGAAHLQMVQSGRGTAWLAARVAELAEKWKPLDVVVRNGSPAMAVVPDLGRNKIEPSILSKPEMAAACGLLVDVVADGRVRHSAETVIRVSIEQAKRRKVDESWLWAPKGVADISPLLGVTAALFKLEQNAAKKPARSGLVVGIR